ncbi:MAG: RNA polymerase sigma factor [Verrucomicrobiae bacterium]|nr:RNA polymerase sigma factor [Verrucomicrobiae bacterium]
MELVAHPLSTWQPANRSLGSVAMSESVVIPIDDDIRLMMSVAGGDSEAMRALIDKWKKPLINFFYRSLGSYAESEDLAQIVFIKLYRASERYQVKAKFSTFLFHIARRVLLNEFRRKSRKPVEYMDPQEFYYEESEDPEVQRRLREIEEIFQRAVKKLPEKHRTALLLYKQQQLSYQEIAEIMKATENAVKTWIHRARTQLRQDMEEL